MRTASLTYITDNNVCNGLSPTVIAATSCTIPLSTLYAPNYSLVKGADIKAYIIATNAYGSSPASPIGSGGIVVFVPDAPINLADNKAVTTKAVIGFTWSPAPNDGGQAVLDYTITYDQSTGNLGTILDTGITQTSYTTTIPLIAGRVYKF